MLVKYKETHTLRNADSKVHAIRNSIKRMHIPSDIKVALKIFSSYRIFRPKLLPSYCPVRHFKQRAT